MGGVLKTVQLLTDQESRTGRDRHASGAKCKKEMLKKIRMENSYLFPIADFFL